MSNRTQTPARRSGNGGWQKTASIAVVILVVMVIGVGCGFLTATINTKPDMLHNIEPPASSQIYDINGNLIETVHAVENRVPVPIAKIPPALQNAFIANEDARFYDHFGIDPRGILRAIWANLTNKEIAEGGSTITQQLAKNAYLTQDRTWTRKIQEVFLALQLEQKYTKKEILEMYLNQIYFGQGAYGAQAAAQTYFGKDVSELDLSECAMLAGIPRSPNYYSPLNNLAAAKERKTVVLEQMKKYDYITQAQLAQADKEELKLSSGKKQTEEDNTASYFIDYVTQSLIDKYGADKVYKEGLQIYTTIDMSMQRDAEAAMKNLPNSRKDQNGLEQPQGALVSIDPHTGYIKAMVGGRGTDKFNRATMAVRQPGSSFKPFVFATAFENNMTPNTQVDDSPVKIGSWEPQNDDRRFRGIVNIRQIATHSINVPTVKLAYSLGIDNVLATAQNLGISTLVMGGSKNDRNLATVLGGLTKGVTPLEMAAAYSAFDNKGIYIKPTAIIKIVDRNGKTIEQHRPEEHKAISEHSADVLTSVLQNAITEGTGTRANIGRPAAGKTGTTDNSQDAWFIGYTPELVTAVWIGCDDNAKMPGMYGGTTPALIWKTFMSKALSGTKATEFAQSAPSGTGTSQIHTDLDKEKVLPKDKNDAKNSAQSADKNKDDEKNNPKTDSSAKTSPGTKPTPAMPQEAPAVQPGPGEQSGKGQN
ncbi:transglycosylase domain-containing protein [Pectinatus haikarae]|uniref:Penicillin-binding protein 1A n=1 Tax=Pectinatus haikarae TaxID=349096 RepID=A0ABT9Y4D4_9FIRM|nr:PBP1A family penicillin-binding protein [Pectinatus haikarae]MDQ0202687.1 penicillin-binding protein 1A [Pectinatus haikarae]